MTKLEIINQIVEKTGVGKVEVQSTMEAFLKIMKSNMAKGENVYFRGFGSFILKYRRPKMARNIKRNTTMQVDAHYIPFFKPSKEFQVDIKNSAILEKRLQSEK